MLPRLGLYYPYTDFRDPTWLKLAALYWPMLVKFGSWSGRHYGRWGEGKVERELRDELGFILDLNYGGAWIEAQQIADEVLEEHSEALRTRYQIRTRDVQEVVRPARLAPRGDDDGRSNRRPRTVTEFAPLEEPVPLAARGTRWPTPISSSGTLDDKTFLQLATLDDRKMNSRFIRKLMDNGLALHSGSYGLTAVHPNFAWAYMCLATDLTAKQNQFVPVSDDPAAYAACGDWDKERFTAALLGSEIPTPDHQDPRSALGMLALQLVVPDNLAHVPVERIINVRKRYRNEFDAFQDLVDETAVQLAEDLADVADARVVEAYLSQEVARRFQGPLEELRRAMRGAGVDSALGVTSLKFELPAAAALAGGWAAGEPVIAAAGAAIGVASWARSTQKARGERLRSSPAGYLWRAEQGLDGNTLLRRLLRR